MAEKKRVLSEQQEAFLSYFGGEARGNVRLALDMAGYSKNISPSYITNLLHEEMVEVAQKVMSAHAAKAAFSVVGLLEDPATLNAKTIIEAAKQVLDRAGVMKKTDQDINLKVPQGGLVILPAKRDSTFLDSPDAVAKQAKEEVVPDEDDKDSKA